MKRGSWLVILVVAIGLLGSSFARTASAQKAAGPALETPDAALAAALHCPPSMGGDLARDPVLLVHGTAADGAASWGWNLNLALPDAGFTTCYVELPDYALTDIQVSSEYVVHALRAMNRASGRRVSVIGHSQGGLQPRWALRWWPDLRGIVGDSISLASTHHGTSGIDAGMLCARGCAPAIFQQRQVSRFLAALNAGDEVWGPTDYTALWTALDMVVVPPAAASSLRPSSGARVANIELQSICPANTASHLSIVGDPVAYAAILDALTHDGPADPARIARSVCDQPVIPGTAPNTAEELEAWAALTFAPAFPRIGRYPSVAEEPPLKPYAR